MTFNSELTIEELKVIEILSSKNGYILTSTYIMWVSTGTLVLPGDNYGRYSTNYVKVHRKTIMSLHKKGLLLKTYAKSNNLRWYCNPRRFTNFDCLHEIVAQKAVGTR